jgi:hypothetical protein
MSTNFAGSTPRLFPWQTKHYILRGGPHDPVIQSGGIQGAITGGYLNVANAVTLNPIPGTQTPPNLPLPRVQNMVSTGTLTVTTATLASNNGGIYVGTIPGGAWIESVEIYCYTTLSGGTSTSVGLFYAESQDATGAAPGFQPTTLRELGYITSPVAGTTYTSRGVPATGNTVTSAGALTAQLTGWQTGPGSGPTGSTFPTINSQTLASNGPPGGEGFAGIKDLLAGGAASTPGDIDLFFVNFLIAGSGTAATAGSFAVKVEFTGLVG